MRSLNATCKTPGTGADRRGPRCCSEPAAPAGRARPVVDVLRPGGRRVPRTGSDCSTGTCTRTAAGAASGRAGAPCTRQAGRNCSVVDGQLCGGTSAEPAVAWLVSRRRAGLPAVRRPCCAAALRALSATGALFSPAGERVPRRRGPLHGRDSDCCAARRSARGGSGEGAGVACVIAGAARPRSLPGTRWLQARRQRVQAAGRCVQLVVRLLQRQLRDRGDVRAGQHGRAALRGGPAGVAGVGRRVRVERETVAGGMPCVPNPLGGRRRARYRVLG